MYVVENLGLNKKNATTVVMNKLSFEAKSKKKQALALSAEDAAITKELTSP